MINESRSVKLWQRRYLLLLRKGSQEEEGGEMSYIVISK